MVRKHPLDKNNDIERPEGAKHPLQQETGSTPEEDTKLIQKSLKGNPTGEILEYARKEP